MEEKAAICILIFAAAEWRALKAHYPQVKLKLTPFGETFKLSIKDASVRFLHGGWGKVAAAASTQYAIDRWQPERLINLGTCGGIKGRIKRGEIVLAEKTIIYDIYEQMSDPEQAILDYTVNFDLGWLPDPPPQPVITGTLISADRDIIISDIAELIAKYNAFVADWESGAIAWVAQRNDIPCLILRGVSDLVDATAGEAYGNYVLFTAQCKTIMADLNRNLAAWIACFLPA